MNESTAMIKQKMQLPQTADEMSSQIQAIQAVMGKVMKPDVHYGVIPGTDKPTLYKAGAEVLLTTFRISVRPEIDDLSTPDEIRYRVHATGVHMQTDTIVGVGVGEASTNEEKYRWRGAGDKEFSNTPEDRRRIKYSSKWGQRQGERVETETQQVRTNPADLANTVLKMAKKRAQVDLCLTALAASDAFAQDLEDGGQVVGDQPPIHRKAQSTAPQRTSNAGNFNNATIKQVGLITRKIEESNATMDDFLAQFNVESVEKLLFADVNKSLEWLREQTT